MEFHVKIIGHREINMMICWMGGCNILLYICQDLAATSFEPYVDVAGNTQRRVGIVLRYTLTFENGIAETVFAELPGYKNGILCQFFILGPDRCDGLVPLENKFRGWTLVLRQSLDTGKSNALKGLFTSKIIEHTPLLCGGN